MAIYKQGDIVCTTSGLWTMILDEDIEGDTAICKIVVSIDGKSYAKNSRGWFSRHCTPEEEKIFLKHLIRLGYHYNKQTKVLTKIESEF